MTNLLNFSHSVEISEIGDYPQISGIVKGYDTNGPSSVFKMTDLETDKNYQPDNPAFLLSKSIKRTDFLSFNHDFFIVSPKVIALLRNFKLPHNRQFPCTVIQGEKVYEYVMLYFFTDQYDFTDYAKSTLTLRFFEREHMVNIVFKTKKNFEKEFEQAYYRFTDIIYCDKKQKQDFDIFKVHRFQRDYFISHKLRSVFIDNGVTGIDYLENVDTVFSPLHEKEILERNKFFKKHFLMRNTFFSNGNICRRFNPGQQIIEEFNRKGKKERVLLLQKGEYEGSERTFYANGNIRHEKSVKSKVETIFKYYFQNGQLNYEISYHNKKGTTCDKVFDIEGKELKNYKLKNGTGKILHFNFNGKNATEFIFINNVLIEEKKWKNNL